MEIVEVLYYFVDDFTNTVDVEFRLSEDSDEDYRVDRINLDELTSFGIQITLNEDNFYNYEDDDYVEPEYPNEDIEIDESELLSFLNEYYTINPDRLPNIEQ